MKTAGRTFAALAELQLAALRKLAPAVLQAYVPEPTRPASWFSPGRANSLVGAKLASAAAHHVQHAQDALFVAAARLARRRGYRVVGTGSSRTCVAVDLEGTPAVAKAAYVHVGASYNLAEAAVWLAFPPRMRTHLTPCLVLTPELVLIQERVAGLVPSLGERLERNRSGPDEAELADHERAFDQWGESIHRLSDALGIKRALLGELHNFGVHEDHVVLIDFAEYWRPIEAAWGWLLHQLDQGPVWLDDAERQRFHRELAEHTYLAFPGRPTRGSLVERAGLRYHGNSRCPCGERARFARCSRALGCDLAWDEAWLLCNTAHINRLAAEAPDARRPPRDTEEAVAEGLAASAGSPGPVAGWTFWQGSRSGLASWSDGGLLSEADPTTTPPTETPCCGARA